MRKTFIIILLICLPIFAKGNRQDDPSYQVEHDKTRGFSPTEHFTQDQIDRVSDIFSGITGNTFIINSDLGDVTSKLIFGRTTGGNGEISWDGTNIVHKGFQFYFGNKDFVYDSAGSAFRIGFWSTSGNIASRIQSTDIGGTSVNDLIINEYGGSVAIGVTSFIGTEKLRVNGNQYNDGTASLDALILREKSSDPADPAEGQSVIWQSDGTGAGDDGDLMVKITAGGVTKTTTLVDFSGI